MYRFTMTFVPVALLGGCALQPAYQAPALEIQASWANDPAGRTQPPDRPADWWRLLHDPAVDRLVAAGLADNPTLAEAAARVDQARAALGGQDARRLPAVGVQGGALTSRSAAGTGATVRQTSSNIGLALSWEVDLWGRIRESRIAALHRLAARNADAEAARLSVIGELADSALALRACTLILDIRDRDIQSRETELAMFSKRVELGRVAPVELALAATNLATAQTDRIVQAESCTRLVDALTALSGLPPAEIRGLLVPGPDTPPRMMPEPPMLTPALPATVLLNHPAVVAAEREAAARWSEIAVARAERLPRLNLAAALSGQWVSALGDSSSHIIDGVEAGLTAPLFDGGAGASAVRSADAAYGQATARLLLALRSATRDVEDSLAAQQSATARIGTSNEALAAARYTLQANEARWQAGAIARFELEDSRRQYNLAQERAINATSDRARAWVALMRQTGSAGGGARDAGSGHPETGNPGR
ncbi:MAG: OprM [Sphingomonas sp.]|nr:MAG: OprM [Sphingomonas sp.]